MHAEADPEQPGREALTGAPSRAEIRLEEASARQQTRSRKMKKKLQYTPTCDMLGMLSMCCCGEASGGVSLG